MFYNRESRPRGYMFLYLSKLSLKIILLIKVKILKSVAILIFISRINVTPEKLKQGRNFNLHNFSFYELLEFI